MKKIVVDYLFNNAGKVDHSGILFTKNKSGCYNILCICKFKWTSPIAVPFVRRFTDVGIDKIRSTLLTLHYPFHNQVVERHDNNVPTEASERKKPFFPHLAQNELSSFAIIIANIALLKFCVDYKCTLIQCFVHNIQFFVNTLSFTFVA